MALRVLPSDQAHMGGTLSATASPPGVTLRASVAFGAALSAPGILPEEPGSPADGPKPATRVVLHAAPAPGASGPASGKRRACGAGGAPWLWEAQDRGSRCPGPPGVTLSPGVLPLLAAGGFALWEDTERQAQSPQGPPPPGQDKDRPGQTP